jgi:GNAT superfamily N-acetyltransferase
MAEVELDNPIWHALHGRHRGLAGSLESVRWYPPAIAPFVAVSAADVVPDLATAAARGLGAPAYFLGVLPESLPGGWRYVARSQVLQLMPPAAPSNDDGSRECVTLTGADLDGMQGLAQVAFPDFFRARTNELGEYLGIFDGGKLIAMASERMALTQFQEISGVRTHPDHVGRGHVRRLTQALLERHRRRGVNSFLHVNENNTAGRRLYESMGFTVRSALPMGKIEPTPT